MAYTWLADVLDRDFVGFDVQKTGGLVDVPVGDDPDHLAAVHDRQMTDIFLIRLWASAMDERPTMDTGSHVMNFWMVGMPLDIWPPLENG